MLRAPLHASRLVVVLDEQRRLALASAYPGVRVLLVPPCAAGPADHPGEERVVEGELRVEAVGPECRAVVDRAVARAREAGARVVVTQADSPGDIGRHADVVVALDSPADEPELAPAIAAMAGRKAVIVLEREATAHWPALDPQTWRPRDRLTHREPVVVSLDPRDEEHSLMLALKGLARDDSRRRALGAAARAWWQANATPGHAAVAWRAVLDEAATTPPPAHPPDWPAHLDVDGAEQARLVAADMGIVLPELA
jgi:hypothetical protein